MRSENKTTIFGIHDIAFYKPNGEIYGKIDVLESSTFTFTRESIELLGGSSTTPFAIAQGATTSELNFTPSEFPPYLFELLMGAVPKEVAPDGYVSAILNTKGDSLSDNIKISIKDKNTLKFGKYSLVATENKKIHVFGTTSVDAEKGGFPLIYYTDDLRISEKEIDLSAEADFEPLGIKISATNKLVTGDVATFEIIPPTKKNFEMLIGGQGQEPKTFGAILTAEKQNGQMFLIDIFKAKATGGLPVNFTRASWANSEITCKCMYSQAHMGVAKIISIEES